MYSPKQLSISKMISSKQTIIKLIIIRNGIKINFMTNEILFKLLAHFYIILF